MIDSAIKYIENNFGVIIIEDDLPNKSNLPLYLSKGYEYKVIQFLEKSFILVHKLNNDNMDINSIKTHISKFKDSLDIDYPFIFILNHVNTYLRKLLINQKISFIVPGKMMLIFELGSIFYERQRSNYVNTKEIPLDKMTPSTQALFLYLLTTNSFDRSMESIAKQLDLTKMSVSRGFNELYNLGLIEKNEYEESSTYRFKKSKKNLWIEALKYMSNPVFKTLHLHERTIESRRNQFIISGESALSRFSMISAPKNNVYGITKKQFKNVRLNEDELHLYIENPVVIQLFTHKLPTIDDILHPLSIALVFKDEEDPRVQIEIEYMLNKYFNNEDYEWQSIKQ